MDKTEDFKDVLSIILKSKDAIKKKSILKERSGKVRLTDVEEELLKTQQIENKKADVELKLKELELRSKELDINLRKDFSFKIFSFLCSYMVVVFVLVYFSGFKSFFEMSDAILITLLTTTMANVIGIFLLVVKYIFKP